LFCYRLKKFGGHFAGERFTAVDAFLSGSVSNKTYNFALNDVYMGYINRLLSLPAMIDWYQSALNENTEIYPKNNKSKRME